MKLLQLVKNIEFRQLKQDLPIIFVGDTVRVGVAIQEGDKKRIQPYEGTVIAQHCTGVNTTITIRRIFQGIGVERLFSLHSGSIQDVKVLRRAKVRKAKLYFLKFRVGKATRLKEKFDLIKNNL